MKISAIIPTYNRPDMLFETVKSVLTQSRKADLVLVADDGGDADLTKRALIPFGNKVTTIWHPNAGKSATLNRSIKQTEGDLIWIVDDDDLPVPDALHRLEKALIDDPRAMFSFGFHDDLVEEGGIWRSRSPKGSPSFTFANLKLSALERCFIFQPGMLVRRSAYKNVGPFDETLHRSQDYDMLLRLSRKFHGAFVEGVVFHQRQHDGERGPAAHRTTAAKRVIKWAEAEREIFKQVYNTYDLSEFQSGNEVSIAERNAQALINRAVIMSRRGLWRYAAADLKMLAKELQAPIRPAALDLSGFLRVFGRQSYAVNEASFRQFILAARSLPQPIGSQIICQTTSPLLGWARSAVTKRQWRRLLSLARMASKIGPKYLLQGYWMFRK